MARANPISTTCCVTVRPSDPAAEIAGHITRTVCDLQDIGCAVSLMKGNLITSYPHGRATRAETANLYGALVMELARIADDLIGNVIRLGDDVLGVLSAVEAKDSHTAVSDWVNDNWAVLFTAFAEQECDATVPSREDWTKRILDTLRAVKARRVPIGIGGEEKYRTLIFAGPGLAKDVARIAAEGGDA